MPKHALDQVLASYPVALDRGEIRALGNAGGFSGAAFWRIHLEGAEYCVRRWPRQHPSRQRLAFIHRVLEDVAGLGLEFVPAPLKTAAGSTFVEVSGHFWEITPWLPGEANYAGQPSTEKLRSALTALARFHQAASRLGDLRPSKSRGISERRERLMDLLNGRASRIQQALEFSDKGEWSSLGRQIVERFHQSAPQVLGTIERVGQHAVNQQPCIRDVWHDHVLFVEDNVTGIVDFGAMRTESVAGDVARLLGSLAEDDREQWKEGLEAYESVRSLDETEHRLIQVFDESSVLLSGLNWLEWIYVDGRKFDGEERILARLRENRHRLEQLTNRFATGKVLWQE